MLISYFRVFVMPSAMRFVGQSCARALRALALALLIASAVAVPAHAGDVDQGPRITYFGLSSPSDHPIPANPQLEQTALTHAVERANTRLPDYARVRHVVRMPETPSLSNGLLTANGRLRRERVLERFGALLDQAA